MEAGRVVQREANGAVVEHLDRRRDVGARVEHRVELEQLGDGFGVVAGDAEHRRQAAGRDARRCR